LELIREFFGRHGSATKSCAYGRSDRQRRPVQPGELSVGHAFAAGQQQAEQCLHQRQEDAGLRQGAWLNCASSRPSHQAWPGPACKETKDEELRSYGDPENIGWARIAAARILAKSCGVSQSRQSGSWLESNLAGFREAAWNILGLLLGVRRVGSQIKVADGRAPFVNFLTDGDHTFFADGVLTHNCGVGGTLTGRGADICIIDDPHTEQEAAKAAFQPEIYDKSYEWYTSGPRQRLQPNGAVIIVATRWSDRDLIGRVLKDAQERGRADEWEVIEFPAILPSGNPLWPEYWSIEELTALKEELPSSKWNAQFMQRPTGEEGSIVKREWWKVWEKKDPPPCEFIIQSWDTAFTKGQRNDFSACTTWGVFHLDEDESDVNIILLDSYKERLEFPELKEKATQMYKEWMPDACIVEGRSSGMPLIFEMRKAGIPVSEYTPSKGNDKFVRLNSVADLFRSGKVWAPDTRWANELKDDVASFPNGAHDDLVDSMTQALIRFRHGGFLRLDTDYEDNEPLFKPKRAAYY